MIGALRSCVQKPFGGGATGRSLPIILFTLAKTYSHILNTNHVDQARLTPGAIPQPDGTIIYPARRSSALTG